MKKLAAFVEGQTEQLFVERLLLEIAGEKNIEIELRQASGGSSIKRSARLIGARRPATGAEYFAMIVDCGADNRVKSDVRDNYERLISSGYTSIVGIRDVAPEFTRADIPELERFLNYGVKTVPIRVAFVLAVMEIEAWFLAEHSHFERLKAGLTCARIVAAFGFNPEMDNMELRNLPAQDLDQIYQLEGLRYRKSKRHTQRTLDVLDYAQVYLNIRARVPRIGQLVDVIDAFLN